MVVHKEEQGFKRKGRGREKFLLQSKCDAVRNNHTRKSDHSVMTRMTRLSLCPKIATGSNPSSNMSTPPRTTPPRGKNAHSMSTFSMCQQQSSSRVPAGGRRPRMAGD